MELAIVGLGKMGLNMATRLARGGHRVIGFARTDATVQEAIKLGAEGAHTLEEAVNKLSAPRIVWLMIPAGKVTHDAVEQLSMLLSAGDIVIDGGNSNYKDSVLHATMLEPKGIEFVDCGTSGGIWGLTEGYSLMIGGQPQVVETLRPIFETLAPGPDKGWGHVGPHGAGHYVKMVHNGIEYGMMQAFAEGFSILKAKKEFALDLAQISHIWQHGSVVRSWLLDLAARALDEIQSSRISNPGWLTQARADGLYSSPLIWMCRRRSSRSLCKCALPAVMQRITPRGCWRHCATNLVAMPSRNRNKL